VSPVSQPFIALMARDRWSLPDLYHAMPKSGDYKLAHLRNVTLGRSYPCEALKSDLSAFFGKPIEELFSERALSGRYRGAGVSKYGRRVAS
jgi:hypothetical protein